MSSTSGQMQGNHISIGGNGGQFFFINWQLAGQSIENNNSVINWQAYFHYNMADAQLDNGIAALSGTRWSNGGRVRNFAGTFTTRDVAVASGSFTIGHNADGTQVISVSGGIDAYQSGRSQGGASWDLPTIPRNSQVTTNATSYTLGDPITIYTNRKSGSFTHTITLRQDNGSGTVLKTFYSVADSVTWTPSPTEITTMEGLIPNTNTFTLFINQYNNQVQASSTATRTLTLTNANPTFNNFTFKDTSASTVAITGSDQVLVKGKSTLEVKVPSADKMVAIKSATASRYDILYDGTTEQEAYSTGDVVQAFTPIASTGSRAIIVRAYDSRGNSTAVTKSVTVYDYVEPNIEIGISRENNFGANVTISASATFDLLPISGVNKNSITAGSFEYRYKEAGGSFGSWIDIAFSVSDNEVTGTDDFKVLDNTKNFEFEFRITDAFGVHTQTATLGAGVPLLFIGEDGTVEANGNPLLIDDVDTVSNSNIQDEAVDVEKLSTGAITLGVATVSSNQGSITTSITDLTSLSVTFTAPSNGRRIKVIADVHIYSSVAGDSYRLYLREGSTVLQTSENRFQAANTQQHETLFFTVVPTAGSHTYKLSLQRATGTGTLSTYHASGRVGYLMVEAA